MGWLIAFVILFLLVLLPIRICAEYNGGAIAWLRIGPVRLMLYPREAGKSDSKDSGKHAKPGGKFEAYETQNRKSSRSLSDLLTVMQIIIDFLKDFKRKLKIKDLLLHVLFAGEDPCDVAVNYGRAWAVLGSLMPQLERHFVIQKRDINVSCDFSADNTVVDAKIVLSVRLGDILSIGIYHGARVLRNYFKNMNKSKAVQ